MGEIWFEGDQREDLPFLVKYIFTSERLSVQVHPDDCQAQASGQARGKTECWYIVDAEDDAQIGIGLKREVSSQDLRAAAIDGSIMQLLDWRNVAKGDFFYVPAGTIHAIGAGVSLLEFQQNSDITYRLYDYGRPRELHLENAVAVALRQAYPLDVRGEDTPILHSSGDFTVIEAQSADDVPPILSARQRWVIPLAGEIEFFGGLAIAGDCLLLNPGDDCSFRDGALALVAAGGAV